MTAAVVHKYAFVNGIRMHYVEQGDGPLVVLLHGFPESWYCWRHQIARLSERYRVIAPDLRGYNETERRGPYDQETLQRDVIGLIDAAGERTAHVVGHDWGGGIAWELALSYPEVVDSLVVCNISHPAIFQRAVRHSPRQMLRSWYFLWFQIPWLPETALAAGNYGRLLNGIVKQCRPGTFSDDDKQVMLAHWRRQGLSGGINWYRGVFRHPARLPNPIPTIQVPTTVIWGENDAYIGVDLLRGTQELVADCTIHRLPGVSHWVQEEEPEQVSAFILEHLQRVEAGVAH